MYLRALLSLTPPRTALRGEAKNRTTARPGKNSWSLKPIAARTKWRAWLEAAVDHGLGLGQQSRFVCGCRGRTACSRSASTAKGNVNHLPGPTSLPFPHPVECETQLVAVEGHLPLLERC